MNYEQYLIGKDTKVKDAMKKIDSVKPKILFVVENEKLVGALTDGDVRRYLLAGGKVTDDADKACNKKLKRIAHSKEEAIKMLDKNYIAIPVINKDGVLLDVYVGNNKEDKTLKKINIPVVINAGGKGRSLLVSRQLLPGRTNIGHGVLPPFHGLCVYGFTFQNSVCKTVIPSG